MGGGGSKYVHDRKSVSREQREALVYGEPDEEYSPEHADEDGDKKEATKRLWHALPERDVILQGKLYVAKYSYRVSVSDKHSQRSN